MTPKPSKASQYTRSPVWVRKDNYAFGRIDNDASNQLVRRLSYANIENVLQAIRRQ